MDRELQEQIENDADRRVRDTDESRPFYERGKLRADPNAIKALDALPRPKTPPRRIAPVIVGDETPETEVDEWRGHEPSECGLCLSGDRCES